MYVESWWDKVVGDETVIPRGNLYICIIPHARDFSFAAACSNRING